MLPLKSFLSSKIIQNTKPEDAQVYLHALEMPASIRYVLLGEPPLPSFYPHNSRTFNRCRYFELYRDGKFLTALPN